MKLALVVAAMVAIVVFNFFIWNAYIDSRIEKAVEQPELCEVQTVGEDGLTRYIQNHPGETELTVIATQNGIKIFKPCAN